MAEKTIQISDIAEENLFKAVQDSANATIEIVKVLRTEVKGVAGDLQNNLKGNQFSNSEDIKKLNEQYAQMIELKKQKIQLDKTESQAQVLLKKSYSDLNDAEKKALQTRAQNKITTQQNNKIFKEQAELLDVNTTAYRKLEIQARQATERFQELVNTQGANAEATKIAAAEANSLNSQLLLQDATVNKHTRNVGNYTSSIITASKGLGGLTGLLSIFGRALGIDAGLVEELHQAHRTLIMGARDLHHVTELNTASHKANSVAIEGETVVTEELSAAQKISTLGYVGIIAGVLAAGAAIASYVYYSHEAEEAEKKLQVASDGTIIKNDEVRKSYNESIIALKETKIEFDVLRGAMTEAEGASAKLSLHYTQDIDDIHKETKKKITEVRTLWHELKAAFGSGRNDIYDLLDEEKARIKTEKNKDEDDELKHKEEFERKGWELISKLRDEANKNERQQALQRLDQRQDEINKATLSEKERLEAEKNSYQIYLNEIADIDQKAEDKREKEYHEYFERRLKTLIAAGKKEIEAQKQINKEKAELQKHIDDATKPIDNDKMQKYRADALKSSLEKERDAVKKSEEEKRDEIQKTADFANTLSDSQADKKEKTIDHELQKSRDHERDLTLLAQQGVESANDNLAFEEANQKKLEEKRAKTERNRQLREVYVAGFKILADTGNEELAEAKITKLSAAIKALDTFFVGTEDTGEGGNLDNKGGHLAILHPHEAVFNAKDNEIIRSTGFSNHEAALAVKRYAHMMVPGVKAVSSTDILFSEMQKMNAHLKILSERDVTSQWVEKGKYLHEVIKEGFKEINNIYLTKKK